MRRENPASGWQRLLDLLAPIHDEARAVARRLARSHADGDELFQDALLRAFDKLSSLRDEDRFRSWFYAVLLSVHRSRSRRAFWRRFLPLESTRCQGHEPVGEDGALLEEENLRARRFSRALATLPARQREAVILFELEDFTVEEIASIQKVSVSAVKYRVARARERLRRHYLALGFRDQAPRPVRRKRRRANPSSKSPGAWKSLAWDSTTWLSRKETHDDAR